MKTRGFSTERFPPLSAQSEQKMGGQATWRASPDVPCRHSWRHVFAGNLDTRVAPGSAGLSPTKTNRIQRKIATLSGSVTPAQPAPSTQTIENRNTIRFRRRQNAQSGKSSRNLAKLCQIVPLCAIRKENLYSQPPTSFVSVTRYCGRGVRNVETPGVGLRAQPHESCYLSGPTLASRLKR